VACGGLTSLVDGVKVEGDAVWERHRVDEKFGAGLITVAGGNGRPAS
jgi:hypothetical protein